MCRCCKKILMRRRRSDNTTKRMSSHWWCCHVLQLVDKIKNNVRLFNHTKLCWSLFFYIYFYNYYSSLFRSGRGKKRRMIIRLLPNWNSVRWMSECYLIVFTITKYVEYDQNKERRSYVMSNQTRGGDVFFLFPF
jgi:hypothetical protein